MEQTTAWWQPIVIILGALGGLESVKWFFNRKRLARSDEFRILRETTEFLQSQLRAKEERFAEQTLLVRKQNSEILELTTALSEKEIAFAKEVSELKVRLAEVRCDDRNCPFREPPNAWTPSAAGDDRKEYFRRREENTPERQPETTI